MPQNNIIIPNKITRENFSRLAKDITSNQQSDDDILMHIYEMMEHFRTPDIPMNRHERRAAKAKYNKRKK